MNQHQHLNGRKIWYWAWIFGMLFFRLNSSAQGEACRFVWSPATWRILSGYDLGLYHPIDFIPQEGRAIIYVGWANKQGARSGLSIQIYDPEGRRVADFDEYRGANAAWLPLRDGPELLSLKQLLSTDPSFPFPDASKMSVEEKRSIISKVLFIVPYVPYANRLGLNLQLASWAYDSRRYVVVIFDVAGRTWEWDGSNPISSRSLPRYPAARAGASMVYDEARGVCVLFGGVTGGALDLNDLWEYDGARWSLRQQFDPNATNRPPAIVWPYMAYDSVRKRTVLPEAYRTWEWDGTNWIYHAVGPAYGAGVMAYDPIRQVTVFFGPDAHTLTWNGSIWRQVATVGPSPRDKPAMAFDVRRKVMVLFGGEGPNREILGDTWEWDGVSWSLVPDAGRSGVLARSYSKMWYDTRDPKMVLLGGTIPPFGEFVEDIWEARPPGYWVDFNAPGLPSVPETGYFYDPFNTLSEAISRATPGCTLNLKAGSSPGAITITKPLTLEAYFGAVTIGQP